MNPSAYNLNDEDQVTYFGETDARNRRLRFGIKRKDRAKHLYAIGKTGMGKSTLLENLAVQDILNGEGLCFLDPHGKSADLLLEYVPEHRIKDVIYFAPFDMEHPVSFNVMEDVGPEQRYLVASGMMSAFKKIWVDAWSARMEYILGNIMLALLEYPGSTLVAVNRMLTDKDFRKEVVNHISDPSVKSFWVNEYANYTEKFAAEAAPAIQNKVGQFVANPLIRNIIGQPKSSFDIRDVMDNRKILIINLSKGRVGEANANLLGSMLITKIYLGAMSRADLNEKQLEAAPNFYLYVDEFQSFANESFADILSEARKYKLSLSIAHQYIEQMTDEVRAAVFGNVGTMVTFRVGAYDAEILEKEFAPYFLAEDIVALQKYQMYLKLMIDGVTSAPFSASGMAPIPRSEINYTNDILASSRALYARPRQQVEDELLAWIQKKFGGSGGNGDGGNSSGGSSGSGANSNGRERSSGSGASNGRSSSGSAGSNTGSSNTSGAGASGGNASRGQRDGRSGSPRDGGQTGGERTRDTANNAHRSQNIASEGGNNSVNNSRGGDLRGARDTRGLERTSQVLPPPLASHSTSLTHQITQSSSNTSSPSHTPSSHTSSSQPPRSNIGAFSQGTSTGMSKQEVGNEREQELRKAMSLSYLKTEPSVPKHEKVPKPENIAALREALLSVMKNEGGILDKQTSAVENKFAHKSDNSQNSRNTSDSHNTTHRDSTEKTENKSHKENGHASQNHTNTSTHSNTKTVKEVEESELKDIFAE